MKTSKGPPINNKTILKKYNKKYICSKSFINLFKKYKIIITNVILYLFSNRN